MDVTLLVVSLLSLSVAAIMSVMAWRVMRDERRRSSARVAALAAEIHATPSAARAIVPGVAGADDFELRDPSPMDAELFRVAPSRSRLPLVATVAAIIVGMAAAASMLFPGGPSRPVASVAQSQIAPPARESCRSN